jgi:uncharacterized membrane protein (DUF106 family)
MFEILTSALNFIFSPLTIFPPIVSLFIVSFLITFLIILINKFFINQSAVKILKAKMEQMREDALKLQKDGNMEKANDVLNEMTKANLDYMRHTFKALAVSILVIILFLPWVQTTYKDITVAKLPLAVPYIGSNLNWFVWYFIASLAIGWIVRKMMGVEYG